MRGIPVARQKYLGLWMHAVSKSFSLRVFWLCRNLQHRFKDLNDFVSGCMVCLRVKASILFSVWEKILRTLTVVKPLFRWTGFLATSRFERRTTGTTKRHKFHSWRRRDKRWGMDEQKIQQGTRSFPTWKGKMSRSVQYVFFSSCHTHYIPSIVMLKCPTRKSVVGPAASSALHSSFLRLFWHFCARWSVRSWGDGGMGYT